VSRRRHPRRRSSRNGYGGQGAHLPDPRGDIPRTPKRTYITKSCMMPRTHSSYCTRQLRDISDVVASNTSNVSVSYAFCLNDLDQSSAFISLFDQYRIDALKFSIVPTANSYQATDLTNTRFSQMYIVVDYDDAVNLASPGAARSYDNCIELQPGESLERTFQPRAAIAAYAGAFNNYANFGGLWIDTSSSGALHYGLKLIINQAVSGQTILQSWRISVEYFITFRSIK
jgi:hypothetical protein